MLVEKLTTKEWIDSIDRKEQETMNERQDFDSFIHVEHAPSGFSKGRPKTRCERDSDTLTYVLTWHEYIEAATGRASYPYQGKIQYCGMCMHPTLHFINC